MLKTQTITEDFHNKEQFSQWHTPSNYNLDCVQWISFLFWLSFSSAWFRRLFSIAYNPQRKCLLIWKIKQNKTGIDSFSFSTWLQCGAIFVCFCFFLSALVAPSGLGRSHSCLSILFGVTPVTAVIFYSFIPRAHY